MSSYDDILAGVGKEVVVVWDIADLSTRFVTRKDAAGLSNPGGYTVFEGAVPTEDSGSALDLDSNSLTIPKSAFEITDSGGRISEWLKEHDDELAGAQVVRKIGFAGVDEANWQETQLLVADYAVAGRDGGAYEISLESVLGPMSQGLYEDFDGESYRLDETTYPDGTPLSSSATTITLEEAPSGWREPGFALLYDPDANEAELVEYQTISGSDLQSCTRRKYAVGPTRTWASENTEIHHVWVKRGNPIDIMLEWLTTTDDGTNGSYDQGDGDGLGLSTDLIDISRIETLRDDLWPQPTWSGDTLTAGTAVLFVEKDPIKDVKQWIEDHILTPFAMFPAIDVEERFFVQGFYRSDLTPTEIGSDWITERFRATGWKRNYRTKVNNLSLLCDWDLNEGEHSRRYRKTNARSIDRYGKAKSKEIASRGGRTGKLGFPDYGSDQDLDKAGSKWLLEGANPWTDLEVPVPLRYMHVEVTGLVTLTVPAVPNLSSGELGETATFIVMEREIDWDAGRVILRVRRRRPVARPAIVGPNTMASDYTSATDADKQYAYICPGSGAEFADGTEAYTVVP